MPYSMTSPGVNRDRTRLRERICSIMRPSVFTAVVVGLVACMAYGVIPPRHGGFYCNDPKISHSYTKDTFRTSLLLILALFPILLVFYYFELCFFKATVSDATAWKSMAWARAKKFYGDYWFGMGINLLLNEIMKTVVAEPRPHFLETCKPDWSKIDCNANDGYVSFDLDLCTDANSARNGVPRAIVDAMRSFPSGHAQLSVFCTTFALLYLYQKGWRQLVASISIATIYLGYALYASISRITDRRHHWWDVVAGAILGALFALLTVRFISKSFKTQDESEDK